MELVIKTSWKNSVPDSDTFESDINSYATFYGLQNYKKWHSLINFEEEIGIMKHTKLFRLFPIRWATSNLHSIQRLDSKYPILVDHLYEVENDIEDFTEKARLQAAELRDNLLDRNFVSLMKIQEDVLSLASYESLHYQKEGQSPIGEYARQVQFGKNIEELQKRKGPFFSKFLTKEVRCTESAAAFQEYMDTDGSSPLPFCNTLQRFEGSTYVVYKMKQLTIADSINYHKLTTYLKAYIDSIKSNYESYFLQERDTMQLFDIFAVAVWPKRMPSTEPMRVEQLAFRLGIVNGISTIAQDWPSFRTQVADYICENEDILLKKPEEFWLSVMNSKHIIVPQHIRELIEFVVIIPSGSADAGDNMPVGISEKGWVIAYSGDWYLYLSLYTQPNIE